MSLLQVLKLPPRPAGPAVQAMPVLDVTASQGVEVKDGQARAVPVRDADPKAVANELRGPMQLRERSVRDQLRTASESLARLEEKIAAAPADQKSELEAKKKQLGQHIGGFERELKQLDADLKALDDPATSRDRFTQILARQKSAAGVARTVEVDRHDGEFEKKRTENKTTRTETSYADGKATTKVQSSSTRVGAGSLTQDNKTTRTTVTAEGRTTGTKSATSTVSTDGLAFDRSAKHETEKDGQTRSTEVKRSVKAGPGGASIVDSKTVTAADGSQTTHTRGASVERGDGKAGVTRSASVTSKDAAGNQTTDSRTHKGGIVAGKDGLGAYTDHEGRTETRGANGLKTGAVAGLSANILCNVVPVPDSDPALYDVVLKVDLGVRVGRSAGYDKEPAKGDEERTRGTVGASVSAGERVFLNTSHRLDATQAQAYVAALKTGGGTQKEFAIIRCGLAKGWDAARALYLGASGKALAPGEADKLKEGESVEVGRQTQAGGKVSAGVKGGGIGVGVELGREHGHDESLKVTKEKDGALSYDAKHGDTRKDSIGGTVSAGAVEGSFGHSSTHSTSTGYRIRIDPKAKDAAALQAALAACRSQAELDAFAKAHPETVQEKTRSVQDDQKQSVGVGLGGAKVSMGFGHGVGQTEVTDKDGKLKQKTVTGGSEGGMEVGVGKYKVGASSKEQATARLDGDGNAALDVNRTDKSTDTVKWLEANVPFAGGGKKDAGALAQATGGQEAEDTDRTDVSGIALQGGDLEYLGHLACTSWNKWMAACRSPRELEDWAKAGRKIKAAGGAKAVVAEQLARFVGADSSGRGHVIDSALRPTAGDMSGGARYEFPGGLAARKASYEATVVAASEAAVAELAKGDAAKAAAKGQELLRELDSLYAAVSSTEFTNARTKAEMLSSINTRKDKVQAALRVAGGGKADELSVKEKVDKYNGLLSNCQRYQHSEHEIFAKIEKTFETGFLKSGKPNLSETIDNTTLINELRGIYTLWDKDYDEMAALAQENGFGKDIYWKYKPDRARFERAYKGQAPGAASAAQPETADKRRKPAPPAPPPAVADPLGEAHKELQKKREAGAQGIAGRLPAAKNRAHGAGNRLYAWIRHERKAAAVDAHNRGTTKLKSADGFEKKVKPGNVEDLEAYGHVAIEDYEAAAKAYAEGLALYPKGMPPKA
ncbi:MAG: hypothetical protein KIT35_28545 [Piscinibacter sp.]|uniref:hypothetical protein n=1 Tax=Piscinibacter sp. TaxID=1903157 RepID=UPI002582AAAA|nr:hypothetical protein [Piscinibacter sp.]MCW5667804.1 hypothetical protein [Piscinibacter sp.]